MGRGDFPARGIRRRRFTRWLSFASALGGESANAQHSSGRHVDWVDEATRRARYRIACRRSENCRVPRGLADLFFPCLLFTIQHHLVEGMGQGLAGRVRTGSIDAGLNSCL
jgi:hypothetical protein